MKALKMKGESIMSFRDNLIHLRAENNMTQEQLAMLLGVSRQSVTKWESEKSYPEMDKLIKMCQLFDCTLDDLVQGDLTNREAPAKTQIATTTRPSDIFGYDEHMNRFATKISTGAACPLIGSAIAIIFFSLGDPTGSGFTNPPLTENVGGALGMLFIAIGIVLCLIQVIPAGLAHSEFVRTHPYIEDFYSTEQKTRARQSFTYQLVFGILSVLSGVVFVILFAETSLETVIGVPVMMLFIAIGAFFIVHGSMILSKTNLTNYNMAAGEALSASEIKSLDIPTERKNELLSTHKRDKRKGAICGMIMLIATIAGLVMLFVPGPQQWYFWLAWPIGGMLCRFVSLLFTAVKGSEE